MKDTISNYFFIKELNKGKHSERIDVVKNKFDNQLYILKMIEKNDANNKYIEREKEIMNILGNDNHPNIMKYYSYFFENNCHCFILEFINGVDLEDFSEQFKANNQYIHQNIIIKIFKGLINGLVYLSQKNILHRDITLDNIMIYNNNNNIKIIDFGLSRFNQENTEKTIVGKKFYISPEIYKKFKKKNGDNKYAQYDFNIDVFSLGVAMFYLMTYKYPFFLNSQKEYYRNEHYIDPNKYNEQLIDIVMSMLETDENKRPTIQTIHQEMVNLIGINNMQIYYQIRDNDINLENNYLKKREAFFSSIFCLYPVYEIKHFFKLEKTKKKLNNEKKDSVEIIVNFIEALNNFGDSRKRLELTNNFIEKISQKMSIFKNNNNLTPKFIIRKLFDYFYYNINEMFLYNNNNAFQFYELIKNDKNISEEIKRQVNEYKEKYSNIFADVFYFLILRRIICPKCNSIIEEIIDVKKDMEFDQPGHINYLLKNFNYQHKFPNINEDSKICKNCYTMPLYFIEEKSIFTSPDVLIIHFNNYSIIEEEIELNIHNINKYELFAIIFKEIRNDNDYIYNASIKVPNIDSWTYYTDDTKSNKIAVSFKEIISKGNISTAFYRKK